MISAGSALRALVVGVFAVRLGIDVHQTWRREIPATRLVVPATILLAALLVSNQLVPRSIAFSGLLAVDVIVLVVSFGLFKAIRTPERAAAWPEERLEHALSMFFPAWFARFVSADATVLSNARAGWRAFANPGPRTGHSYVNGSKLSFVAMIVGVSVVPDAFLFWVLLRNLPWLAAAFEVLDVWAFLWLLGLYGTMASRPHDISSDPIVLRNGILQSIEVRPEDIASVRSLGLVKRPQLGCRRGDGSAVLGFGGVPLVDVTLRQAALERHLFMRKAREVRRIFVSTDDPDALVAELQRVEHDRVGRRVTKA